MIEPRPWAPKCPRCGGRELRPCSIVVEASDRQDDIESTHECADPKCGERFKVIAPDRPEVWP